jgi:hypothetical protein
MEGRQVTRRGTFITEEIVPFVTTLSPDPETGRGGSEQGATYSAAVRERGREADAGTPAVQVSKCPSQIAYDYGAVPEIVALPRTVSPS